LGIGDISKATLAHYENADAAIQFLKPPDRYRRISPKHRPRSSGALQVLETNNQSLDEFFGLYKEGEGGDLDAHDKEMTKH